MKFTTDNQPSNRGRKVGSVNKSTSILRTATPSVLKKLVVQAKGGDMTAISVVRKDALPPKKPESEKLCLSSLGKDATLSDKANLIADSAINGNCDPVIASQLINALGQVAKMIEIDNLIERIEVLEYESQR